MRIPEVESGKRSRLQYRLWKTKRYEAVCVKKMELRAVVYGLFASCPKVIPSPWALEMVLKQDFERPRCPSKLKRYWAQVELDGKMYGLSVSCH